MLDVRVFCIARVFFLADGLIYLYCGELAKNQFLRYGGPGYYVYGVLLPVGGGDELFGCVALYAHFCNRHKLENVGGRHYLIFISISMEIYCPRWFCSISLSTWAWILGLIMAASYVKENKIWIPFSSNSKVKG